jgi:hypothetical protein
VNATMLTIIRIVSTVAITGFTAAFAVYPHELWIPAVIAALGVLNTNIVPAIGQTMITINPPTALTQLHVSTREPFTGE